MKHVAALFLLFLSLSVTAQNWSPVTRTDTLNFRLDGENILSASCFITGFSVNGNDSTFTYNQIGCDSCLTLNNTSVACASCYGLQHQPQAVTGYSITKDSAGQCTFIAHDQRVLHTLAHTGDSWTFEASQSITAQITAETTALVLGQTDSIKIAILSSGDSLVWSKNYGIVLWPQTLGSNTYYRLVGMNGRGLGEQMLTFKDYFGFSIGQIFQFHIESSNPNVPYVWRNEKYTITGVQQIGNDLVYTIQGLYYEIDQSGWPGPNNPPVTYTTSLGSYTSQLNCINDSLHMANQFHHAVQQESYDEYLHYWPGWGNGYLYALETFVDAQGVPGIRFNKQTAAVSSGSMQQGYAYFLIVPSYNGSEPISLGSDTIYGDFPPVMSMPPNGGYALTLKKNLGGTFYWSSNFFEGAYIREMTAYTLNGDTTGTFLPDGYYLGTNDPVVNDKDIQLFPNPASTLFTVELPVGATANIAVTDLQGRLIHQEKMMSIGQLDCSGWENGVYLLIIRSGTSVSTRKLVVQH